MKRLIIGLLVLSLITGLLLLLQSSSFLTWLRFTIMPLSAKAAYMTRLQNTESKQFIEICGTFPNFHGKTACYPLTQLRSLIVCLQPKRILVELDEDGNGSVEMRYCSYLANKSQIALEKFKGRIKDLPSLISKKRNLIFVNHRRFTELVSTLEKSGYVKYDWPKSHKEAQLSIEVPATMPEFLRP